MAFRAGRASKEGMAACHTMFGTVARARPPGSPASPTGSRGTRGGAGGSRVVSFGEAECLNKSMTCLLFNGMAK